MTDLADELVEEENKIVGLVYVLKLVTGETVIADVDVEMDYLFEVNRITLMFPAKIIDVIDSKGNETAILKPWMPHSEAHGALINTEHIIFPDSATHEILEKYIEYVTSIQEQLAFSDESGDDSGESEKTLH